MTPTPASSALRVPGVSVRDVEPAGPPGLPRLDVAAFVGFAERGPVDQAVALDEPADFGRWFGRDVELDDGEFSLRPLLARAVRSFFENGGRRCWVVRVAGPRAAEATFSVPGLYRADRSRTTNGPPDARAVIRASSPGAWANDFGTAVRLLPVARSLDGIRWVGDDPGPGGALDRAAGEGAFRVRGPDGWSPGDLLRIRDDRGVEWLFAVDGMEAGPADRPDGFVARGRFVEDATRILREVVSPPHASPPDPLSPPGPVPPPPATEYDGSLARVEALTFDLYVDGGDAGDEGGARGETLRGLGFHPEHPRYLLRVLAEESRFLAPLPPEDRDERAPPLFYPFGMSERFPPRPPVGPRDRGRDDLGAYRAGDDPDRRGFSPDLFAPAEMERLGPRGLMDLAARAQEERHRSALGAYGTEPLRLRGLLGVLPVDEVALIAVPDAVRIRPAEEPEPEPEPEPEEREGESEEEPPVGFRPCPSGTGGDAEEEDGAEEEEAAAESVASGPETRSPPGGFLEPDALAVQRAALRLCRLRGDMVAVLAAPEGVRPVRWRERLLRPGDDASYATLYHPWIRVARDGGGGRGRSLEAIPPDGAACGVIARRERARGAWIAPANEPVRDCLGLAAEPDEQAWAEMLAAGVNLIRRRPGDFRIMSARTLSVDRNLSELNVRRLLILLKKALGGWGMDFVFEPHGALLRSSLKQRIETALEWLFRRGAFSGRVPEEGFQVVVDETVNPPPSVETGHLIALVKVAPSWPMEFLEVRLVRTGEGLLRLEEA